MKTSKLKASSLAVTLIISLLMIIVCGAVLLTGYYDRLFLKDFRINDRLNRSLSSATNMVLADTAFVTNRLLDVDLFGKGKDSVSIYTTRWGLFESNTIKATYGRFQHSISFLSANHLPNYMNSCLYLADHKRPLYLVGATRLNGDVAAPAIGVKPGFISQRGFDFSTLAEGNIRNSEESLPALREQQMEYIKRLKLILPPDNNMIEADANTGDSIIHSFGLPATRLSFSGAAFISGKTIKGKVMLVSDSLIEIDASAHLEHVILVAPVVKFDPGFRGSVQVFAEDSIITGENCQFDYPSNFMMIKRVDRKEEQPQMRLGSNNKFQGCLISYADKNDVVKTYLEIGAETNVYGAVYCLGYAAIYGSVSGIVLSDYLVCRRGGQFFENHLLDVTIDKEKLSPAFLGSDIFYNSGSKDIIAWVD